MKTRPSKPLTLSSVSPINIFIVIVCIIFMAGGAVNNGFSWFVPAVPFAIIFGWQLRHFSKTQRILIVSLTLVICLPLIWNHPKNNMLYPSLNAEIRLNAGWGYHQFMDSKSYSLVAPKHVSSSREHEKLQPEFYSKELVLFENKSQMRMSEMKVSHPDFGTSLTPVFKDEQGNLFSIYIYDLTEGIKEGTIQSPDLQGVETFQSSWTRYLGNLMYWPITPLILLSL